MPEFPDDTPLGAARRWVSTEALRRGTKCPCCGQRAQVYKRTINSGMAESLAIMWARARTDWINVPNAVGARSREEGKLRYWGLVEENTDKRMDGGHAGWWRVTEHGATFLLGGVEVPKYALVYDGVCMGLAGDPVGIDDCVRNRFDLRKLLSGQMDPPADLAPEVDEP